MCFILASASDAAGVHDERIMALAGAVSSGSTGAVGVVSLAAVIAVDPIERNCGALLGRTVPPRGVYANALAAFAAAFKGFASNDCRPFAGPSAKSGLDSRAARRRFTGATPKTSAASNPRTTATRLDGIILVSCLTIELGEFSKSFDLGCHLLGPRLCLLWTHPIPHRGRSGRRNVLLWNCVTEERGVPPRHKYCCRPRG